MEEKLFKKLLYPMRFFCLLLLQLAVIPLSAQMTLSLEQCLQMARSNSPAARSAQLSMQANYYDYESFKAGFLPQLSLSADLPGLTRSITNITQDDGTIKFIPQSQTFSTVSLNLSQQIPQTGGTLFAYSSLFNRLDLENGDNVLWQSSPFVVGFRQPLFQINRMKWERQIQGIDFQIAQLRFSEVIEQTAREVQEIFFDALIASINYDIASKNVANNDTIFQISKGRYNVGKIAENELLQSELSYLNAQTEQASAQINYEQAIRRLKIALGLEDGLEIQLLSPSEANILQVDPEEAIGKALEYSNLIQTMDRSQTQAEQNLAFARQNTRPTANLNASFGLNGTDVTLPASYQNLVDRETFSLGLEVPLLQWGAARAEVQAAEARADQARLENQQIKRSFENDIRYRVLNLQLLSAQLFRASKGDTVALRRYELTKNRYLVGKVDIQALFIAQNEKDNARRSYITTLRSYWRAVSELRISSLYDFEKQEPIRWNWN